MKRFLTIIGTRPEAIKLAPILQAVKNYPNMRSQVCLTQQHTSLLIPLIKKIGISADFVLPKPKPRATLHQKASTMLKHFDPIFSKANPDLVLVQGDTSSAFVGALAAHYSKIPVVHVEAGLRTGDLFSPWPEEVHRRLIDQISSYFFVPTDLCRASLLKEGFCSKKIWVVGNTSIDALCLYKRHFSFLPPSKRNIVVTVHRRENHGPPLKKICFALKTIAQHFPDVSLLFFLHPNPHINQNVCKELQGIPNILLKKPTDHFTFLKHLSTSTFIITDSGGIQEEAPYIGKPVLLVRDNTERPEGIINGSTFLVGTESNSIFKHASKLLTHPETLTAMSKIYTPYGEGNASKKIVKILAKELL